MLLEESREKLLQKSRENLDNSIEKSLKILFEELREKLLEIFQISSIDILVKLGKKPWKKH